MYGLAKIRKQAVMPQPITKYGWFNWNRHQVRPSLVLGNLYGLGSSQQSRRGRQPFGAGRRRKANVDKVMTTIDRLPVGQMEESKQAELHVDSNLNALFVAINEGDLQTVRHLVEDKGVSANSLDSHKISALQQAAFRGHVDVCQFLLANGADANGKDHPQGYTALIFGALSGNPHVCRLLLDAGAIVHARTTNNRDALDMAAFTGQSRASVVIQLYIPYGVVQPYVGCDELASNKLTPEFGQSLHKLVAAANFHPISMFMYVADNVALLEQASRVANVLERLMEFYMAGKDMNEVLAIKMCIAYNSFKELIGVVDKTAKDVQDVLPRLVKNILSNDQNGVCNLDNFIVSTVMKYPNKESILMQQFMKEVFQGVPSTAAHSYHVICKLLMGSRILEEEHFCECCGEWMKPLKLCSSCRQVRYCSVRCQKLHWSLHKAQCVKEKK